MRPTPGDRRQPLAVVILTMPRQQTSLEGMDLDGDRAQLISQRQQACMDKLRNVADLVPPNALDELGNPRAPCGAMIPNSAQWPRTALISLVRWRTRSSRVR